MDQASCLPKESLAFQAEFAAHDDKQWFAANKARCERDVVEPARALVRGRAPALETEFPEIG